MEAFTNSIASLFSTQGIVGFILGVLAEYCFIKIRCHYLDRIHPEEGHHVVKFKRVYVVWIIVFITMGSLAYKTQVTYDRIVQLSLDTQECSAQFNDALKARGDIASEENGVNYRWQDANIDRINELNLLAKKFGGYADPRYLEAKTIVDQTFYDKISKIFEDRNENQRRRMQTPYPEPTCGR